MTIQTDHSKLTVTEALIRSIDGAVRYNPDDAVRPCAVLWTDHDAQWLPVIPRLRLLLPHLLTLGEYQARSAHRAGDLAAKRRGPGTTGHWMVRRASSNSIPPSSQ